MVLLWVAVGLLTLGLIATATLLSQLLRQHGRVLLRLDVLEAQLGTDGAGPAETGGLAVGTVAPEFSLPDLDGRQRGLDEFRGHRLLLVQWSLTCGFCEEAAPHLAMQQSQLRSHDIALVLVSDGDAKSNRRMLNRYGLDCPVLLQPAESQTELFKGLGTPVAYLLDEQGRVAAPLAIGSRQVPALVRTALARRSHPMLPGQRPLSESRIKRDGLDPGTAAPDFRLPGVNRRRVALADFRGRRVALVFSDPACAPCNELLPDLVRIHREAASGTPEIVMVSRGDRDANVVKCAEHGVDFPVGLQRGWALSRQYGMFATPIAFLIDENGTIAEKVAEGPEAIVALISASQRRGEEATAIEA